MQNTYYDKYWKKEDGHKYSGQRQGYAPNFLKWMDSELRAKPGEGLLERGLEAGCGDASFTHPFSSYFTETHAIDISHDQIQKNAIKLPAIRFRSHDLSQPLPYPDGHFDAVWCSEVLEHLFDPLYAIQEFRRVLRPGGKLLVTVPYHGGLKNVMIALFKWDHHFDLSIHISVFSPKTHYLKSPRKRDSMNCVYQPAACLAPSAIYLSPQIF